MTGFLPMLEPIVQQMLLVPRGAVEAPAGTGKTEQITLLAGQLPGRWLILTHTVAGVEAIRRRLRKRQVADEKTQVDTIAAWSYRWARAFPVNSGLATSWTTRSRDWTAVLNAAASLVESGAVESVLKASFDGILVDEYQDCSVSHHRLVKALSQIMRCYVFGDPLQAIFGFGNDPLVDWESETVKAFPLAGSFSTGHRWNHVGDPGLGAWLIAQRTNFRAGHFDFVNSPNSVTWVQSAEEREPRDLKDDCFAKGMKHGHTLSVLHSSVNEAGRAELAKFIGATTVEPIGGRAERNFYDALRRLTGTSRVGAVLELAGSGFAGANAAEKRRRVDSILNNPSRMRVPPNAAELALSAIAQDTSLHAVLDALNSIAQESGVTLVRPELINGVRATLRHCVENPEIELEDASWHVANMRREKGRIIRNRSVGSTLLVKGLEFDHVVITPEACTSRYHWYVALTRAAKSVKILSPKSVFNV
ncbi:UvrD-helicase domain-containing protein [Paraburkholderia agricolaris]|uniref:DNA 3'-5' helicase II n=1 Tax=Paraburkholderia agricolaris TaxID=2152888 RepID=A0ABW8ZIS9_9BURK